MDQVQCPAADQLGDFVLGKLQGEALEAIASHVDTCPACDAALTQIERQSDPLLSSLRRSLIEDSYAAEPELALALNRAKRALAGVPAALVAARAAVRGPAHPVAPRAADPGPTECSAAGPSLAAPGDSSSDSTAADGPNFSSLPSGSSAPAPSRPPVAPAAARSGSDLLADATLGQYQLVGKLGEGGMGAVYKALHTRLEKFVALKVLATDRTRDPHALARFHREMKAVGKLDHPNIVRALDAGEHGGTHFLVMEYLDGLDLAEVLRRAGPLAISEACEIIRQAALGLAYAHRYGLVHRDIKPSNLMLTLAEPSGPQAAAGLIKVMDLGLALFNEPLAEGRRELTGTGHVMGTVDYMAPEQATDSHLVDIRADIYSLGATLYKLLTGEAPLAGPKPMSPVQKLMALVNQPAPPITSRRPDVPAELGALVARLLEKDPALRPPSPAELAGLLGPFCAGSDLAGLYARARGSQPQAAPAVPAADRNRWVSDGSAGASRPPQPGQAGPMPQQQVEGAAPAAASITAESEVPAADATGRRTSAVASRLLEQLRRRPSSAGRKKLVAMVSSAALVLLLGVIVAIQTADGTVEISSPDGKLPDDVSVVLRGSGQEIEVSSNDNWTIKADQGDYQISIRGGNDQFEIKNAEQRVTVRRFGKEVITIVRKPAPAVGGSSAATTAPPGGQAPPLTGDPDRRAAEYVLSIGGAIWINDQASAIGDVALLPKEAFRLTTVSLAGNQRVTDAGLAHFKECKNLAGLNLDGAQVSDAGLAYLKDCKNLTMLYLSSTRMTEAGLAHFRDCKNLTHLHLYGTQVTDAGLAHFKACKNLTELYLQYTQVTDAGLAYFKDCKNLTVLVVVSTPVTDAGLAHFKDCKNLTYVNLASTQVTDAGLAHFKDCKNLTYVELPGTQVTDAGLAHFKERNNLTLLYLNGTRVTDAGLAHFKDCKGLTVLYLAFTQVTDAGLAHLKDCRKLVSLNLAGTQVSDLSLPWVSAQVGPQIFLQDTRISRRAYEQLKGAHPSWDVGWSERNHDAAQAVLKLTGQVEIAAPDEATSRPVTDPDELITKYFQVRRVSLACVQQPLGELPVQLSRLSDPEFDRLERLDLSNTSVPDLDFLKSVHGLLELVLANGNLNDATLGRLPRLRGLKRLVLDGNDIRAGGIRHLAQTQPQLEELSLARSGLNDLALVELPSLNELRTLSLAGTAITDRGLKEIAKLTKLNSLDLRNTKISAEGAAALQQALPACKITWDGAKDQ